MRYENKYITSINYDFLVDGKIVEEELLVTIMRENFKQQKKELERNFFGGKK